MKKDKIYDLIIIGAGPAGLAASIYASRYGLEHVIIGRLLGGQISETHVIDNYPGMENVPGVEFAQKWGRHAQKYGVKILPKKVKKIKKNPPRPLACLSGRQAGEGGAKRRERVSFEVELESGESLEACSIILATGVKRKKLNILGEKKLIGRGVSYCATCDGFFYKNKTVGVIGGSNSAAGAAVYLGNICQKVYLIYRKSELRAEFFWVKEIEKNPKIEIIFETNVTEIIGIEKVEKVRLDKDYKASSELFLDGLFIEAGFVPALDYAEKLKLATDNQGYIKIKKDCATNVSGIFAAGDITDGSDGFRQVITAASEGAIAARSAFNGLKGNK